MNRGYFWHLVNNTINGLVAGFLVFCAFCLVMVIFTVPRPEGSHFGGFFVIGFAWLVYLLCKRFRGPPTGLAAQGLVREQAQHHAYRTAFTEKIAEVATAEELRRLDALWAPGEWSYDDQELHSDLVQRWCQAHPARYPSQDQLRQRGFLCDCQPAVGHACRPEDAARQLAETPAQHPLVRTIKSVLSRDGRRVASR